MGKLQATFPLYVVWGWSPVQGHFLNNDVLQLPSGNTTCLQLLRLQACEGRYDKNGSPTLQLEECALDNLPPQLCPSQQRIKATQTKRSNSVFATVSQGFKCKRVVFGRQAENSNCSSADHDRGQCVMLKEAKIMVITKTVFNLMKQNGHWSLQVPQNYSI